MTWTHFWDMHSGGGCKLDWNHIFVEMPEPDARAWFEREFGRDPDFVTCGCCGEDYSVVEGESLQQATAFLRNCAFDREADGWVERQDPSRADIRQRVGTDGKWGLHQPLGDLIRTGQLNDEDSEGVLIVSKDGPLTPNWTQPARR